MSIYAMLNRWLGDKPWFRPVAMNLVPKVDRALLHHGWHVTAFPTLLLISTGANSGRPHETPLWYSRDGAAVTVVASNYGRREPDWSRNLAADPRCTVTLGRRTMAARARLATGDDARRRFEDFVARYPPYRDYRSRAGREIPVWVLELLPAS